MSAQPVRSRFGEIASPTRDVPRSQVVRPKVDNLYGAFQLDHKVYPAKVLRKGWLFRQPAPIFSVAYPIPSSPLAAARGREASAQL
jgi:hypothetical protein